MTSILIHFTVFHLRALCLSLCDLECDLDDIELDLDDDLEADLEYLRSLYEKFSSNVSLLIFFAAVYLTLMSLYFI